ncbi:hypothetical protein HHI36_007864 [Cryptolaemus montrouzieri]|uniref:Tetraspanin n=1 Tax=Cryptolaemus montrouzieri TaxID=559131 RepID=A0ABD2MQQ7_9CUCU
MVGFLLISIGTVIKTLYIDFDDFLNSNYYSPSDLIIFAGFVIFFVAFFGCWGAMKQSTQLINMYALCLVVILTLEVLAALSAISMRGNLSKTITSNMNDVFKNMGNDSDEFDFVQSQLCCCGVQGPEDWMIKTNSNILPSSCCVGYDYFRKTSILCGNGNFTTTYYVESCADQVVELVSETAYLLTSGAICVAFVQVIGIIFARLLSNTIRKIKVERLVEAELRRQQIYSQIILGATMNGEGREKVKVHNTAATEA